MVKRIDFIETTTFTCGFLYVSFFCFSISNKSTNNGYGILSI